MKYQALFFSSLCLVLSSAAFAQDNGMLDSDRNPATRSPASVESKFSCTDKEGGLFDTINPITVTVQGETLTVSYQDGAKMRSGEGTLDHKYAPRGKDKTENRFSGSYENLIDESGSVEVLSNKEIFANPPQKPFVKLQWKGESFYSNFYDCTPTK